MCIRVVERYAVCGCVYFVHGVDQCGAYGRRGHGIEDRIVPVGHTCPLHATGYNHSVGPYSGMSQVIPSYRSGSSMGPSSHSRFDTRSHR